MRKFVAVLSAGLLLAACNTTGNPSPTQPITDSPAPPTTTSTTSTTTATTAPPAVTWPGLYYIGPKYELLHLTGSTVDTVPGIQGETANVSPDGKFISYVDRDSHALIRTDGSGGHRLELLHDVGDVGFEPAWSPDSNHLLLERRGAQPPQWQIVNASIGSAKPFAAPADFGHPIFSADGKHIAYQSTKPVGGGSAEPLPAVCDADGKNPHQVPNHVGDQRFGQATAVSPDGTLLAVALHPLDWPWGDIARSLGANTVVRADTGQPVALPVAGQVLEVLFRPDGEILVRTKGRLTLLNADRTVKASIAEPAELAGAELLASVVS